MVKILLVDDEEKISDIITRYLVRDGYLVLTATNGREAIEKFDQTIDLIVLDLMLPDLSGEEVCLKIREISQVPIIMLTARVSEENVLNGFSLGADDYVTKPFSPKQLLARIQAILKRSQRLNDSSTLPKGLYIDDDLFVCYLHGEKLDLTVTEFKIIGLLSRHKNKVFSRNEMIDQLFGYDYKGYDRTLDSHIKNLRKKLNDHDNTIIKTVYGVGYKMGDLDG